MTEKEKMLAGDIYSAVDPQLIEELTEVKEIIHDYNLLRPSEKQKAREILKGLLSIEQVEASYYSVYGIGASSKNILQSTMSAASEQKAIGI